MSLSATPLFGAVITWLTPIWLLGLGAALGLFLLLVIWGLVAIGSRNLAVSAVRMVRESVLWPLLIAAVLMFIVGLAFAAVAPETHRGASRPAA